MAEACLDSNIDEQSTANNTANSAEDIAANNAATAATSTIASATASGVSSVPSVPSVSTVPTTTSDNAAKAAPLKPGLGYSPFARPPPKKRTQQQQAEQAEQAEQKEQKEQAEQKSKPAAEAGSEAGDAAKEAAAVGARKEARKVAANRPCGADELRILVKGGEQFIVKDERIFAHAYLASRIEKDGFSGERGLTSLSLQRISGDQFEPVAEYFNQGDFEPRLVRQEADEAVSTLHNVDYSDKEACKKAIGTCTSVCHMADALELKSLTELAVKKAMMVVDKTPDCSGRFLAAMSKVKFCGDESVQEACVAYAAKNFHQILRSSGSGEFADILEANANFAKQVHRSLSGLPAVDPKDKKRKRAPRPRKAAAARPAAAKAAEAAPASGSLFVGPGRGEGSSTRPASFHDDAEDDEADTEEDERDRVLISESKKRHLQQEEESDRSTVRVSKPAAGRAKKPASKKLNGAAAKKTRGEAA